MGCAPEQHMRSSKWRRARVGGSPAPSFANWHAVYGNHPITTPNSSKRGRRSFRHAGDTHNARLTAHGEPKSYTLAMQRPAITLVSLRAQHRSVRIVQFAQHAGYRTTHQLFTGQRIEGVRAHGIDCCRQETAVRPFVAFAHTHRARPRAECKGRTQRDGGGRGDRGPAQLHYDSCARVRACGGKADWLNLASSFASAVVAPTV